MPNLLLPVPEDHMNYASQHVVEAQEENYYQEYFNYVMENTQREFPSNWQQALRLYELLINYARNGQQV
jgi:hypothetical protein